MLSCFCPLVHLKGGFSHRRFFPSTFVTVYMVAVQYFAHCNWQLRFNARFLLGLANTKNGRTRFYKLSNDEDQIEVTTIRTNVLYFSMYIASSLLGTNVPNKIYRDLWC